MKLTDDEVRLVVEALRYFADHKPVYRIAALCNERQQARELADRIRVSS